MLNDTGCSSMVCVCVSREFIAHSIHNTEEVMSANQSLRKCPSPSPASQLKVLPQLRDWCFQPARGGLAADC